MDIITASDIAYTITLVKNGELVWLQQIENAKIDDQENTNEDKPEGKQNKEKKSNKKVKPRYTLGEGEKAHI